MILVYAQGGERRTGEDEFVPDQMTELQDREIEDDKKESSSGNVRRSGFFCGGISFKRAGI